MFAALAKKRFPEKVGKGKKEANHMENTGNSIRPARSYRIVCMGIILPP